ncbi:hypothetical protein HOY80DRAFT_919170 [Tuber brumale]|nr:hypothetical protein HOY80DRAFT_919170 [Tuber brumale]
MMRKPTITSHFRGGMEELKTADGIILYAHKSILDLGTGSRPDAPWDSFTTSTVERFLEHCYQGDYSSPKPAKLPLATPTSSVVDGDGHADGVFIAAPGRLPRCQSANGRAIAQDGHHFCCSCVTIQDDDAEEDEAKKEDDAEGSDTEYDDDDKDDPRSPGHPNGLDYFEVFFAHAELYILSQTQGRSSLTSLCLDRLRAALDRAAGAPARPRFATNLSRLLFYVYEHGNVRLIDDNQVHDLQNLASSYAAMHIQEMKEECSSLMRHGGKMAEDLMKVVADRAINLDSALKEREKKERDQREREGEEGRGRERQERERERQEREEKEREQRERQDRERQEKEERERQEREERERQEREERERQEREEREKQEREERERQEREERERQERERREREERERREREQREKEAAAQVAAQVAA